MFVTLGIFIFLSLIMLFSKINLERITGLLEISDKYSYEMYLTHHLIILGPFSLMTITPYIGLNICFILIRTCIMAYIVKLLEYCIENRISAWTKQFSSHTEQRIKQ